jgi:acetolactate decarboxylase
MPPISVSIPQSLISTLIERAAKECTSVDHLIAAAVAGFMGETLHTLFQVSTSAALVEGLYQGAVRVALLKQRGDFGLGTFIDLNGEMVVLEGAVYQVTSDGKVCEATDDLLVPYAVVTTFDIAQSVSFLSFSDFAELEKACDALRKSENLFYAIRIDGTFASVHTRVMHAVGHGTGLAQAASAQGDFQFEDVTGTLVGIWAPAYAGAFSVPGYHFHFISSDRLKGGHVLACKADAVVSRICSISEMHIALPETKQFLQADLSRNPNDDLASAERSHSA